MPQHNMIKLVASIPEQYTHNSYQDAILGVRLGITSDINDVFSATKKAMRDQRDTLITAIEGAVKIKDCHTGKITAINAGDSVIIPQGYDYRCYKNDGFRAFYLSYQPLTENTINRPTSENIIHIDEHNALPWQETSDGFKKKQLYQSYDQKFTAGVWQGGSFSTGIIAFPYNEFITLTQGSLLCSDENGVEYEISVGQALFVPQGARCAWQSRGKINLNFVQIRK